MAQLGKDKKHKESLEDIVHDAGAEQSVEAKEKKKKVALFGTSGKKKDKTADFRSERRAEEVCSASDEGRGSKMGDDLHIQGYMRQSGEAE